jgi:hypothetical protein
MTRPQLVLSLPSPASALFPTCLRHLPIPIFGTYHTILIDTPAQPLYTRIHALSGMISVKERRFP